MCVIGLLQGARGRGWLIFGGCIGKGDETSQEIEGGGGSGRETAGTAWSPRLGCSTEISQVMISACI